MGYYLLISGRIKNNDQCENVWAYSSLAEYGSVFGRAYLRTCFSKSHAWQVGRSKEEEEERAVGGLTKEEEEGRIKEVGKVRAPIEAERITPNWRIPCVGIVCVRERDGGPFPF